MRMDDLCNALSSKGFLPEPPLDIVEDFGVRWVRLVKEIFERQVCRPKTITEVLCKDPATI
jgi:hypothetical protein